MKDCQHSSLCFDVSSNAEEAGYKRAAPEQRLAATQPTGRVVKASKSARNQDSTPPINVTGLPPLDSTFPAPLVLPGDELSWDPKYPPQSLRSWTREQHRNAITDERKTVYVVHPPEIASEVSYVKDWASPALQVKTTIPPPDVDNIVAYLQTFYHGLPVKVLDKPRLRFCRWDDADRPTKRRKGIKYYFANNVGLDIGTQAIRVRARQGDPSPQLNLNDLLEAAIEILPGDAYALLMVVHQDLYEDDDDDFCCGRAYGGSRVAVVSTARYNPAMDVVHEVDRQHAWPASHCRQYMGACCTDLTKKKSRSMKRKNVCEDDRSRSAETAMDAALAAHQAHTLLKAEDKDSEALRNLWLGRVCKTASHELGHCFGMDHCVYYACVMQATAGLSEDARQPPYVCPVDTAKVLKATGAREQDWLHAMLAFCERFPDDSLFAAYVAWLRARLEEIARRQNS